MKRFFPFLIVTSLLGSLKGGDLEVVSRPPGGGEANNRSENSVRVSRDGRIVVFYSTATNLVAGDTNGRGDLFVADRVAGTVTLVTVSSDEIQHGNSVGRFDLSGNGRFVAFECGDDSLVSGDTNGEFDILVRDLQEGTTERVSIRTDGMQANDYSLYPSISYDGRYVAFQSNATNLVNSDGNAATDVFVRDRLSGITTIESVSSGALEGNDRSYEPSLSDDGGTIAFSSDATDLVAGDTNGNTDVFVRNRLSGTIVKASVDSGGTPSTGGSLMPELSGNGKVVAFLAVADDLVASDTNGVFDVIVRDLDAGVTELASVGTSGEMNATPTVVLSSISHDGRFVGFQTSTALDAEDFGAVQDVFIRDRRRGTTTRFSVANDGSAGNGISEGLSLSGDGRTGAFLSLASNLAPPDFNGFRDVFAGHTPYHAEVAAREALLRKITALKKKAKLLKKKGKSATASRLLRKAKLLTRQLAA